MGSIKWRWCRATSWSPPEMKLCLIQMEQCAPNTNIAIMAFTNWSCPHWSSIEQKWMNIGLLLIADELSPPLTYFALLLQNYLFTTFRNVSLNWISAVILLADRCYNCLCLCLPDIVEVTLSHISAPLQGIVNRWFMLKMSQIKCSKTTNMLEITR